MFVNPKTDQIESVIMNLQGVEDVKAVIDPSGEILEIHVIINDDRTPKQAVRDIESVLMARLNIPVDHKKISIAQMKGLTKPTPLSRVYVSEASVTVSGKRMEAKVTLERGGESFSCCEKGAYAPQSQLRLVATATAGAIVQAVPELSELSIEEIRTLESAGKTVVFCHVQVPGSRHEESYVGAVIADQDLWRAAVNATLDALNRRLGI